MRNPWPTYSIAAFTVVVCCVWDRFFSYKTLWIAAVMIPVLWGLYIFAGFKYERWLAAKINPYVVAYQSDHDLEKLKQGLDRWRPWAFSKWAQNIMMANWFAALLEEQCWEEAENILKQFLHKAKSVQDKMEYHLLRKEYAGAIGDIELENQEQILYEACKNQLTGKMNGSKMPATAKESKHAFFCWLSFSLFLPLSGGVISITAGESVLGAAGAGQVVLSLFAFPVSLAWLALWLVRRRKERIQ